MRNIYSSGKKSTIAKNSQYRRDRRRPQGQPQDQTNTDKYYASAPAAVEQPAKPSTFTCADYDPLPGSKRCRSYLANGGCAREDHFMCEEWMKASGQPVPIVSGRCVVQGQLVT